MKVIKAYSWIYDIVKAVANGEPVPIDEINLVGGRNSGKSVSMQILYSLLSQLETRVGLVGIRANKDGGKEFFNEMVDTFEMCGVKMTLNKSEQLIKTKYNSVRIIGLNSMSNYKAKKSGLARLGEVKYIFIYYEERFEFDNNDYLAIKEAIRGFGKDIQTICINVCNPWAKSNPYIQYCDSYQKWNLRKLKETGNQFGIYEEVNKETGIKTRKLFQYTNWRVAKDYLQRSTINNITDTWNIDRNRAVTTDYGMPGYEWGAIYTHLLDKIGIPIVQTNPQYVVAGLDYGWSSESRGGKTAAVFGVANDSSGIDIYGEYVHDPAAKPLPPDIIATQVVEFYLEQMKQYCSKLNRNLPFYVRVRVDNMAVGVISILNSAAKKYRVDNWLSFTPCAKFPILDRIDIQQAIMSRGLFRVDNSCIHLYRDFEQARYKEEVEKRDRVKENDHGLNAYEYGIEHFMYPMGRKLLKDKVFYKKWKEDTIW